MEDGLWCLFFQTGLPEIWMVLQELKHIQEEEEAASISAFFRQTVEKTEC